MEKAIINDSGTTFAYIDSGPPSEESYTTLICVHGHSYHARNFDRLLPLSKKYNIRVIAFNRRDYEGSTPLSTQELEAINGDDADAHAEFLRERGLEIALFIGWAIKEKSLPPIKIEGASASGGIVLLGWSLGNITTLAFLANLDKYPVELNRVFKSYLRRFDMYDLPNNCIGCEPPQNGYHPLRDSVVPERTRGIVFGKWVSTYYNHPAYSSAADPSSSPLERDSIASLQVKAPFKSAKKCTLDRLSPRELLECVDIAPGLRSERAFWNIERSVLRAQTAAALLGSGNSGSLGEEDMVLPSLQVRVMYGLESLWVVHWETWRLEDEYKKWAEEGKKTRPVTFIPIAGANHFLHWDDAERFLEIISQ